MIVLCGAIEQGADALLGHLDGSFYGLAQRRFEFGSGCASGHAETLMLAGGSPLALEERGDPPVAIDWPLVDEATDIGGQFDIAGPSDPNIVKLIDVPQTLAASENPRLARLVFSGSWVAVGLVLSKGTRRLA
jgi:hypothetical protein